MSISKLLKQKAEEFQKIASKLEAKETAKVEDEEVVKQAALSELLAQGIEETLAKNLVEGFMKEQK